MNNIEISYTKLKYPKLYQFGTILPGALSIIIISITIFGYGIFFFNEQANYQKIIFTIAIFILFYYIWWLIRGFEYIIFIFMSTFKIYKYEKINFHKILFENKKLNNEENYFKKQIIGDTKADDIIHRFIIPTRKESFEIIDETINNLATSNYNIKKYAVTLAGEQVDEKNFLIIAKKIINKYKNTFGYLNYTVHTRQDFELPGKGGNIKFAANIEYKAILENFQTTPDKILLTSLDADTNIDKEYSNILTHTYLSTENRKYKSYQPMIFFFNNFWDAPFFSRIVSLGNSFWILFNSLKKFGMRNFSTHAQPLDTLIELKFWSCETIVEDGHQYRRSFFGFNGKYECIPIYTKVYQDANMNKNIMLTAKAQYNQIRRWAHGSEDIAYVLCQWLDKKSVISFTRTFYELGRLIEGTILWSTLHIILMVGLTFSFIKDIPLSQYVSLGTTISFLIKISFLMALIMVFLQLYFSPWHKIKSFKSKTWQVLKFLMIYIWLAGPTLVIFSGIPAIHTQIALMIGKPMKKFNITLKNRKN